MIPPLAWVLLQPAVLTARDEVHRFGCGRLDGLARVLRRGEVLWRVRAPVPCPACRPRLELRLRA